MEISYICDRKKACNTSSSCGKECIRTCDVSHSVHYRDMPHIKDLRKNFDVSGYGTNEKWIEKAPVNIIHVDLAVAEYQSVKFTNPIIGGKE